MSNIKEPQICTVRAIIKSLSTRFAPFGETLREVTLVESRDDGYFVVEYEGELCIAVLDAYTGRFFVDDVYGRVGSSV